MNGMYLRLACCFAFVSGASVFFGVITGGMLEKVLFVISAIAAVGMFLWGMIADPEQSE